MNINDRDDEKIDICIVRLEIHDDIPYYIIQVVIRPVTWNVSRRYSEFDELHTQIEPCLGASRDESPFNKFPSKSLFQRHGDIFLEKRRSLLQEYLLYIVAKYGPAICWPRQLAYFLHANRYETSWIVRDLIERWQPQTCENSVISQHANIHQTNIRSNYRPPSASHEKLYFTVLQIHSIEQIINYTNKHSHAHIHLAGQLTTALDVVLSDCVEIELKGDWKCLKNSDLLPSKLDIDLVSLLLGAIKLETLILRNVSIMRIRGRLSQLCQTLRILHITGSGMCDIECLFAQTAHCKDRGHTRVADTSRTASSASEHEADQPVCWSRLTTLLLNDNHIASLVHVNMSLCNLRELSVSRNNLSDTQLAPMHALRFLVHIDLSHNRLSNSQSLVQKLPIDAVQCLYVSHNHLRDVCAFAQLSNLHTIDASFNYIDTRERHSAGRVDVRHPLPELQALARGCNQLRRLCLQGNVITHIVSYRARALQSFAGRWLVLDNEESTACERNVITVLGALCACACMSTHLLHSTVTNNTHFYDV